MSTRRGAILLEVLVSVAVFVASAMTLIGILAQSNAAAARARDEQLASDLCRSAIAELSLGQITPEALNGPVHTPEPTGQGFADSPPPDPGWELVVATEPSSFAGLIKVRIDAVRVVGPTRRTCATLWQLVPTRESIAEGRQ